MPQQVVVIWDIGKTNAKLCAVDRDSGAVLMSTSTSFTSRTAGTYRHLDTDGIWEGFLVGMRDITARHEVTHVVVTAHGATSALVDDAGLVLPVLDYEDPAPDATEAEYATMRPLFTETYSPPLPGSLNFGRGLYWQSRAFPAEFARARHILCYAQYWTWRLCGVAATEVSSIGSHSDLWAPCARSYSSLVGKLGWERLLPPIRKADEVLGTIKPEVAAATGLPAGCQVLCGIHDSNASLLPWLKRSLPFTVSSTGTWVINFAVGADLGLMDPARDCAANVTMYGDPVACSRWMGGREHASLAGEGHEASQPGDVELCLAKGLMHLPPQGGQSGPFPGSARQPEPWLANAPPRIKTATAALYCALVLDTTLDLCASAGPVIVEGPFSRNATILSALAGLRPDQEILCSADPTGTTLGAARLAIPDLPPPTTTQVKCDLSPGLLARYRVEWRSRLHE